MTKLVHVLRGERHTPPPVWLMRQAGRYLPEYRELRGRAGGFMAAVFDPAMAVEITLQPMRRFAQLDAAILFSDILVIPHALGQQVDFVKGEGPQLGRADNLSYAPEKLDPIYAAVRGIRAGLSPDKALIGFAGSPWTVACYMLCGGNHDEFMAARAAAHGDDRALNAMLDKIIFATIDYLDKQVVAGANALQLFESWGGLLAGDAALFDRYVIAPTKQVVAALKTKHAHIPVIGFPRGGGTHIPRYAADTGIDAVGLDWGVDLAVIDRELPKNFPVQGNLDPALVIAGGDALRRGVEKTVSALENRPHVFNLGHGLVPATPPDHVAQLLQFLKKEKP